MIEASPSSGEEGRGAAGFIFRVDLSQVHLTAPERKPVLTDRPLRWCQSMKGMNEQSDLIVLTLRGGRTKVHVCGGGARDAGRAAAGKEGRVARSVWAKCLTLFNFKRQKERNNQTTLAEG